MKFMLIHGSWHGAWCWYKIASRLRADGHEVCVPDLHGRGRTPGASWRVSLNTMAKRLAADLMTGPKARIVVHSRYGVLASYLSEFIPDRIEQVIYLASYLVGGGEAAATWFRRDDGSLLRSHIDINRVGLQDWLRPEIYREGLYHDCSADDLALAQSMLCPEPLRPAIHCLHLSTERYGGVPRSYIRLTQDRAVSIALQDRMLERTSVDRVESIDASHSAYFSKPDELAAKILKLAGP